MRWLALAVGLLGMGAVSMSPKEGKVTVFITGGMRGQLSPCGCTSPMSGGIRRVASAVKLLGGPSPLILDNGEWVKGTLRQDQLKAEAVAEAWGRMGVAAVHMTASEAALGPGEVASLNRLAGGCSLSAVPANNLPTSLVVGPFTVVAEESDTSDTTLASSLKGEPGPVVVLTSGGLEQARRIATMNPSVKLVAYSLLSQAPPEPARVGNALLVTTGEEGKAAIKLTWDGTKFSGYRAVDLGPSFPDDPSASRAFRSYQDRVAGEHLLEQQPRISDTGFAGSRACAPCHAGSLHVWQKTGHARALASLEAEHSDRDPDCVSCHVVGLESRRGFQSRQATPGLSDVGCESCHGALPGHLTDPRGVKYGKAGPGSCTKCHDPSHSPAFAFSGYWPKIRH